MPSPTIAEGSTSLQVPSRSQTFASSQDRSSSPSRPETPQLQENGRPLSIAQRRSPNSNGNGLRIVQGVPLPPNMAEPMQDGYRTPMGEDYEQHFQGRHHQMENIAPYPTNSSNGHISWLGSMHHKHRWFRPGSGPGSAGRSHLSFSAVSEKLDEKIHWKQRMRHFTWNFFSMTMATGGIANVIRTGNECEI